jgi:hypothetical protein
MVKDSKLSIQMIRNGSIINLFRININSKFLSKHSHKNSHNHILPKIFKKQVLFRKNRKI